MGILYWTIVDFSIIVNYIIKIIIISTRRIWRAIF